MLSRRGFLIGAGSLLTATFVKDAKAFVSRTRRPMLEIPPEVDKTMCWYDSGEQGYLLTIGRWTFCPPPPTWRGFFVSEGIGHHADCEIKAIEERHGIDPGGYDDVVDGWYWETRFDLETGPCARAYRLLEKLDIGPEVKRGTDQPHLMFCDGDVSNDASRWVEAKDEFAISLLQARLIDLKLPIKIEQGG